MITPKNHFFVGKEPCLQVQSLLWKLGLWVSEMSTNIQISLTPSPWDNPRPLRKMLINSIYTPETQKWIAFLVYWHLNLNSDLLPPISLLLGLLLCVSCMLDGFPKTSEALLISLHSFFFLFLRQDNLIWPIFKFADSFFSQFKAEVQPSSEFFISVIVFSIPQFLFVSLFLFLLLFNIWWDIILYFSSIL